MSLFIMPNNTLMTLIATHSCVIHQIDLPQSIAIGAGQHNQSFKTRQFCGMTPAQAPMFYPIFIKDSR
jgi:hypothetical protein